MNTIPQSELPTVINNLADAMLGVILNRVVICEAYETLRIDFDSYEQHMHGTRLDEDDIRAGWDIVCN